MPHILQHPKAHDVFQIPIAVLIPALVRKILRTALVVRHRRFQLHANEAPRAARKEHRVLILRRHRQKRGSRVVRSRKPHRQIKTDLLLHALCQPAERFTRLVQLAEDFLRQTHPRYDLLVPCLMFCRDHRRRACVRVFVHGHARKPVCQIVRDHQKLFGLFKYIRHFFFLRRQLIHRVELLHLNARSSVQPRKRHRFFQLVRHRLRAAVAVRHRRADAFSVFTEQNIIHCPRVHRHTLGRSLTRRNAVYHFAFKAINVPVQMAVLVFRPVFKTVDFFQLQFFVLEPPQNVPPA